jgi:DtxR family Mn-dependent transcriptional regulator
LSENVEMYLETIYVLTEKGGRARTTDVAIGWDVVPSSATEMIQRLAAGGYLDHEPYHGVALTERGRALAEGVVRKHRLLEVFLTKTVGMKAGKKTSDYACEMEHVLPAEVERWMCETLGHPRTNPAGEPIPPGECCAKKSKPART